MSTSGTASANGTYGTPGGDPSRSGMVLFKAVTGRSAPASAKMPLLAFPAGVVAMGCAACVLRCSRCCSG
eukprot:7111477-Lingulodinium_polyedra.AAC.1